MENGYSRIIYHDSFHRVIFPSFLLFPNRMRVMLFPLSPSCLCVYVCDNNTMQLDKPCLGRIQGSFLHLLRVGRLNSQRLNSLYNQIHWYTCVDFIHYPIQ